MLQIIAHAQNPCAKDVHKESTNREGGNARVEVFGSVEAEKTAWWCENESKRCAAAPEVLGREDAEEDGAEPAAKGKEDGKRVEDVTDVFEGESWHDRIS